MRDLSLLSVSLLLWGVGEGMFLVFQPIYLQELGADPVTIGLALGGYGIGQIITHVPAGYLSDRFGPKPLLLAAWGIGTLAAWIMALARSLPLFILGMGIYGTTLFVLSPLNSYVTSARGKLGVGRAITLTSASFNLGGVIGPGIGGIIGEGAGLRSSYLIAASLFILSSLLVSLIRPLRDDWRTQNEPGDRLRNNRVYLIFLGVIFLSMLAMYLAQPLAPNYLQNQQDLSLYQIGLLYSISGVGIVVLNLVLGQLKSTRGFAVSQMAVGAYAGILWRATGLGWYAVGYFLLGGYRVARSLAIARTRPLIRGREIGLAYAWVETVGSLSIIISPVIAGSLYKIDPSLIFSLALTLILLAFGVDNMFNRWADSRRPVANSTWSDSPGT